MAESANQTVPTRRVLRGRPYSINEFARKYRLDEKEAKRLYEKFGPSATELDLLMAAKRKPPRLPPGFRRLMRMRTGGCLCGAVRYEVKGEPLRAGLCHCADCRKESGSAFVTFAVWPLAAFEHSGSVATYEGRSFCPACGGRLFCLTEKEAELRLGSLDDAPMEIEPLYEVWIKRRESWLHPLQGSDQYQEDAG